MSALPYLSKRTIIRIFLFGILGWLLFTLVRSWQLLSNGRRIAQHSEAFKRDYYVGNPKSRPLTYLVMGDSTAAGWGAAQLSETYAYQIAEAVVGHGYYVHIVNVAIGGARLGDVNEKQLPALKQIEPDIITFSFGANDATHFTAESDYSHELERLFSALTKSSARRILISDIPDMFQAPALPLPLSIATNNRARRLNAILDKSLKGTNLRKVDLYNDGKLIYGQNKNLYAVDLFHPSSEGYRVWAKLFIRELSGL